LRAPVRRAEGYEVSDKGEVFRDGQPVKVSSLESGYKVVNVYTADGWRTLTVARIVLEAFIGPKPPAHEARHVDGDPSNCVATNLCWEPRGRNRIGKPHKPDTLGHELKDKRRKKRENKKKVDELKAMKRQLRRMAEELGVEME